MWPDETEPKSYCFDAGGGGGAVVGDAEAEPEEGGSAMFYIDRDPDQVM